MATSVDSSTAHPIVTLDLDDIRNIGHPYWELAQPSPSIIELFYEFNRLFFDDTLEDRVAVQWSSKFSKSNDKKDKNENVAGEALPPQIDEHGKMKINLNAELLRRYTRRETIEILIHEMIHAYLIHTKKEDSTKDYHGVNFKRKMNEINALSGLKVSVEHELLNKGLEKYYMWRCRNDCRDIPPYFGYIWIKAANREPQSTDSMWMDGAQCEHQFERIGENPKEWLTQWECITKFNKEIEDKQKDGLIRIKTKKAVELTDVNNNDKSVREIISSDDDTSLATVEDEAAIITNKHYVNFDRQTKEFMNVDVYLKVDKRNSLHIDSRTVCMICLCKIADESVIAHLKKCTGVEFSLDSDESLPIFKID